MENKKLQVLVATDEASANGLVVNGSLPAPNADLFVETDAERLIARLSAGEQVPDVVVLDMNLPGLEGIDGVRRVLGLLGDRPLAVLVDQTTEAETRRLLAAGARGVLPRDLSPAALGAATALLAAGERFSIISESASAESLQNVGILSDRELQVLHGICSGLQNKEIAHAFDIREVTVKMHVRSIIRKLGARNRTHAAMRARDLGIV